MDKEVNEAFPTANMLAHDPSLMDDMPPERLNMMREDIMEEAAMMPDTIMSESMSAIMDEGTQEAGTGDDTRSTPTAKTSPAQPVTLLSGTFTGRDNFHQGSGNATLYRLSGDAIVLRFENFSVTNGPDLRVLLAQGNDPAQSIELAPLKGNRGDQNYPVPTGTDVSQYDSVIIYCKPFHVIFATAELR